MQAYAQSSGEKLVVDPRVKGKVNALGISLKKLSFAELTTVLHVHNYSTCRGAGILVVVPSNVIKHENVPLIRDGQVYADYETVTDLIFLEKACEQNFISLIQPLISPTFFMSTNDNPRSILIVNAHVNTLRVRDIVEKAEARLDKKIVNLVRAKLRNSKGSIDDLSEVSESLNVVFLLASNGTLHLNRVCRVF